MDASDSDADSDPDSAGPGSPRGSASGAGGTRWGRLAAKMGVLILTIVDNYRDRSDIDTQSRVWLKLTT